jgi:predicted CopG family antitoxin
MIEMSKTITISDEAYERLAASKRRGESFTEVILRELPQKGKARDIMDLVGSWQGDEEEYEQILRRIAEGREESARRVEI